MHKFYTFEHRLSWFYTCVNRQGKEKAKKYGANAPQLHHIIQNAIFPLILAARRMKAM
jgi:hypothetical protein